MHAAFLASFAMVARNIIDDFPKIEEWLYIHIGEKGSKTITCGFCFTYWTALIYIALFHPLPAYFLPGISGFNIFFEWFVFAFAAVSMRSAYLLLQEIIYYFVHILNQKKHYHPHSESE